MSSLIELARCKDCGFVGEWQEVQRGDVSFCPDCRSVERMESIEVGEMFLCGDCGHLFDVPAIANGSRWALDRVEPEEVCPGCGGDRIATVEVDLDHMEVVE